MRIASVTNTSLNPSLGSGKTVIEWTKGLQLLGHSVDVFAPEDYYRPLPGRLFHRLKMRWDACKLRSRLWSSDYDLIEFYGGEFGWLIKSLKKKNTRPLLVAHTNGLELLATEMCKDTETKNTGFLKSSVQKLISACDFSAFSLVDAFAGICSLDQQYLIKKKILPAERTATVETGIDQEFFQAQWDGPKTHRIIYLGTWCDRKDTTTLVAVASQLLEADNDLGFDIIGAGASRSIIYSQFDARLHERIQVHPRLTTQAMAGLLSKAKVFVFPSLYEGFGMATAEAMACGCVAVVTPTGFAGTLENEKEAFVRPFGDKAAMIRDVQAILHDEKLREVMARNSRERVESMNWPAQVQRLETLYLSWLKDFR